MVASASQIAKSVTPGSIPQGGRQQLAGNLQSALAGGGGGAKTQALGALRSGTGKSPLPITDGLSVGPGTTPMPDIAQGPTDRVRKLQLLATSAKTPHLRAMARNALRRETRPQ